MICFPPQLPCYQMCCPHGQAYLDNPEFDFDLYNSDDTYNVPFKTCQVEKIGEFEPQIIEGGLRVDWRRKKDFLLVAPKAEGHSSVFRCDEKHGMGGGFLSMPQQLGVFNFLTDGRFQVNLVLGGNWP